MRGRTFLLMAVTWASAWSLAAAFQAVSDGLYTDEQASRGESVYQASCARCHGETLLGNDNAIALVGEPFMKLWTGRPVGALLVTIRVKMPTDGPGVLTRRETADVAAFVLRANGFRTGPTELPTNERLVEGVYLPSPRP